MGESDLVFVGRHPGQMLVSKMTQPIRIDIGQPQVAFQFDKQRTAILDPFDFTFLLNVLADTVGDVRIEGCGESFVGPFAHCCGPTQQAGLLQRLGLLELPRFDQ